MAQINPVAIKLKPEIKERIKNLSVLRKQSAHWIMRTAINEYLEQEEKREAFKQEIMQAQEHYENTGLHVTNTEVKNWITSVIAGKNIELPKCHI